VNNFHRVLRNTLFLATSEILLKALGVLWTIFLARSLSIDLFGRYNLVNSFVGIFSFLPDFGVGLIVIRDIAKKKDLAPVYLGNSLVLNGILAFITFFVILIVAFFVGYSPEVQLLIIIASLTLFLSTLRSVGIFFFDGMEKMEYSALFNTLNTVLLLTFGFVGFQLGFGLSGVFWGMFLGTCLSLGVTWLTVLRRFVVPKVTFDRDLMKHFFLEGMPLGIAAFAALIYTKIDSVLLGYLLGEKAVGIYNVATPFAFALVGLLNVPFVVALYPTLSRLSHESHTRFMKAINKSLGIIALWSFPASFFIALCAFIIPVLFGHKYDAGIPILRIHIFMVPFMCLSALLYKVLIILNRQKVYLYISIFGAIINIILNILLIPIFQVSGAAFAAIITQVSLFVIYVIAVYKSQQQVVIL
jgi:O-antigen/teichoic acid export membrane protein